MSRLVSVVLPVYDEHDSIATCLAGLDAALASTPHEILVVYDRDEDTTLPAIANMPHAPRSLRLVKNDIGRGAANALRAGFAAARGDVVVTTMADLSDPPELIPLLAERVRAGAAVVSGSRYMPGGSQEGGPRLKVFLSRLAGRSLAAVAGMGTSDATSNFRAYETAFLRATQVESDAGFEIALELTVKAHLAGREVSELPSSWRDRSHGESRFRLWKWLPNYLRWYGRAMAAPVAAFGAALALGAWALVAPLAHGGDRAALGCAAAAVLVAGAFAALLLARRARGRLLPIDVAHPVAWLLPWLAALGARDAWLAALVVGLGASAVLLAVTPGARACGRALARLRPRRPAVALLCALVTFAFWASRLGFARPSGGIGVDPSWQQAIAYALAHGLHWGEDILFTYGPLGTFAVPRYEPGVFWMHALAWEVVLELAVAVFLTLGVLRIPTLVGRAAATAVLLLGTGRPDADAFVAVLAAGSWLCADPRRPLARALPGLAVLAAFALVKFTALALAVVPVLLAGLLAARRRSPIAGLGILLAAPVAFVALWLAAGQTLAGLAPHLTGSLWIARGYQASMGLAGSPSDLRTALFVGAALLALLALDVVPRPRTLERTARALLALAAVAVAAKAAFVRHDAVSAETFFAVAGAAAWLGPWRAREQRELLAVTTLGRLGVSALCLVGLAGDATPGALGALAQRGLTRARGELGSLVRLDALEADLAQRRARLARSLALPDVKARVGDAPIDLFENFQGLLLANDLAWHPRPAFQSYFAYGPELARANARFLRGDDAPRYALFKLGAIDERLPFVADGPALRVLLRDYEPLLIETGHLLLERRADAPRPEPGRRLLLEADVAFGERLELAALDPKGDLVLAEIDLEPTARGRIANLLTRTPPVTLELELDAASGTSSDTNPDARTITTRARLLPELAPLGFPVRPLLLDAARWQRWYEGGADGSVRALTLHVDPAHRARFAPTARVRLVELVGLCPPEPTTIADAERPLDPEPDAIDAPFEPVRRHLAGGAVLVVGAPSEVRFDLAPGSHALDARFGLAPGSDAASADFHIALREREVERALFTRRLDPDRTIDDRGPQRIELTFETTAPASLLLRVEPTAEGNAADAYWTDVRLR